MASIPKHARYATQALFDSAVSAGSVPSGAVCFIEDTRQIWVEGVYYTLDDAEIEEKISEALGDYYTKDEVAKLIGDLDQEVKDVVSDVSGLKTEVAGKAEAFDVGYGLALEDGTLKVTLDPTLFVVVKELPTEPDVEDEGKLHLVPMGETEEGNEYAEWLWVDGKWELMGTLHTKVDLEDYYTKGETDAKLALYLPLEGGTVTGDLEVNGGVTVAGDLKAKLRRHDDAPNVVLSDMDWTLYQTPVEKFVKTLDGMKPAALKAVVAFHEDPDNGTGEAGADDISLWDVVGRTDEMTSVSLECDDGRFSLRQIGLSVIGDITNYYISCTEKNDTGHDIHTTLKLTFGYSDGSSATVNLLAVQSAAASSASGTTAGHTGACDGVYVAYVDYEGVKRICSASEWSADLGAAQGVMVGDGTHELLLAPTQASSTMYWSKNTSETVGGVITTTSSSTAQKDFNGRLDTEAIINMGGDYESADYAPGFCHNYAYGAVGAGEWWLPSSGELHDLIYANYSDINDALSAIGGTALNNSWYWSSTQYGSGDAWYVDVPYGYVRTDRKDSNPYVRAVAAFDYEL